MKIALVRETSAKSARVTHLAHIFGQIVSMRVKTPSNTNLVASSHIITKFTTYIFGEYFLVWYVYNKGKGLT